MKRLQLAVLAFALTLAPWVFGDQLIYLNGTTPTAVSVANPLPTSGGSGGGVVTISGVPVVSTGSTVFVASAYNGVYTVASGVSSPTTPGWENVLSGAATSILLTNTQPCTLNIFASIDGASYNLPVISIPVASGVGAQLSYPANGNFYEYSITNNGAVSGTFNLNVYYGAIASSGQLPKALAQSVSIVPTTALQTARDGTITSGGVAQPLSAASTTRTHFLLSNPPTATETLYVSFTGTASASSWALAAGGSISYDAPQFVPSGAISIFAATTSHAFNAEEY